MRFMIIVKASPESEAGTLPDEKSLTEMGKFNEELIKAGVMLAGEGLQASSKGARIQFDGKKRAVVDGPFAESKELVAGFWLWQVKSKDEAIEWAKRIPFQEGAVEIRQVFENEDFGDALKPEIADVEDRWRQQSGYAERKEEGRASP
ncbi:MAG: YciI family protein [Gemmatimonadaceae bacterium]